ncbi:MAG: hypothetical protein JXR36_01035 [Bacteroidales bacterium]|nr:hypothetical protein [Bacteroidales bacterium]
MKTSLIVIVFFCLWTLLSCNNSSSDTENNDELSTETVSKTPNNNQPNGNEDLNKSDETPETLELINLTVYLCDPDDSGVTNLRSNPNGKILKSLEHDYDYIINLDAQQNGWFRIESIEGIDTRIDVPKSELWIHHSVVGVDSKNYGNQTLNLYLLADSDSDVCGQITQETTLRVTKLAGDFAFVFFHNANGEKISGWIKKEWLCGNPVTNCC